MNPILLLGAGAVVVGVWLMEKKRAAGLDAIRFKDDATPIAKPSAGAKAAIVVTPPAELALAAGVPLDVYSLARMTASEHGGDGAAIKAAVAWAIKNAAKKAGVSITQLLTRSSKQESGKYGSQNTGRYASTIKAPKRDDLAVAGAVIAGAIPDPTGGAVQFDSPRAQRALVARGTKGYTKTPEEVAETRMKSGAKMVVVAGVDADYLRFWRYT